MTGQHKDLGFLGFSQLFNIKSRVSNFLLNNRKNVKNPKSECWLASASSQRCLDCRFWSGACKKGKRNVIAVSEACELFEPKDSVSVFLSVPKGSDNQRKPKKLCPKCHLEGSGPYARWVLNPLKKRYEPYYYFAHKREGKVKWCYLGRLSNKVAIIATESDSPHRCVDCANLTEGHFCVWHGAYIKKEELLTQTFECEGFKPKPRKLSNSKGCGRKVLHL
jgi:hypothetical protein